MATPVESRSPGDPPAPRGRRARYLATIGIAVLAVAGAAAAIHARVQRDRLAHRLLADLPDAAGRDPALVRFAAAEAKPLFAEHCAVCHGANMRGNTALGGPDLTDQVSLYGDGGVYDIERTVLYGIRAGVSHTRDISYMPGFGLKGTFRYQGVYGYDGKVVGGAALTQGQIWDLVQYLLKVNHRPYQAEAAELGEQLSYEAKTSCRDCHAPDLEGIADYGAPNLTINVWNNGSTPEDLFHDIYFGVRHMMPAWRAVLTLEQIRALAVYLHSVSRLRRAEQPVSRSPPAPMEGE